MSFVKSKFKTIKECKNMSLCHVWFSLSVLGSFNRKGCRFKSCYGQCVVSLSKALYHNNSSQPRFINGYRQCWEGNRLVEVVQRVPHDIKMSLLHSFQSWRWAVPTCVLISALSLLFIKYSKQSFVLQVAVLSLSDLMYIKSKEHY